MAGQADELWGKPPGGLHQTPDHRRAAASNSKPRKGRFSITPTRPKAIVLPVEI